MSNRKPIFVVCDLETTGLDHKRDVILEAAFAVTDAELNVIDSKAWIVLSSGWETTFENASDLVRTMHTESGLIDALNHTQEHKPSENGVTTVANEIFTWLFNHGVEGNYPLMSSTIGFDRRFLKEHMPQVEACFSYQVIDVSSIKELCKVFNPNVYAAYEKMVAGRKKPHRARLDIAATLEELEFYMNEFLLVDFDRIMEGQEVIDLP